MSPLCKKRGEETGFLDPSAPSLSKMCQMRHRWTRLIASMWFKLGEVASHWDAMGCSVLQEGSRNRSAVQDGCLDFSKPLHVID